MNKIFFLRFMLVFVKFLHRELVQYSEDMGGRSTVGGAGCAARSTFYRDELILVGKV